MATAKNKTTVSAEIPKPLKTELDGRSKAEERSRSEVIGRAIRFYLDHAKLIPASAERPVPKDG